MRYATPTPAFPCPPHLSIDIPEGWVPRPEAGGLMAFAGPVDAGFQANVVVTATRVDRGLDLDAIATMTTRASAAAHNDFSIVAEGHGVIGERPALLRAATFAMGNGRHLYQAQMLVLHTDPNEATVNHLVRFEGTCTIDQADAHTAAFREMAMSIILGTREPRASVSPPPPEPPSLDSRGDGVVMKARNWLTAVLVAEIETLTSERDQTLLANTPDVTSRKSLARYNRVCSEAERAYQRGCEPRHEMLRSLSHLSAEEILRLAQARGWTP